MDKAYRHLQLLEHTQSEPTQEYRCTAAPRPAARHAALDPSLRGRLALAVERRHAALAHTAGLNEEVFDALVVLAAGTWSADAIARGHDAVQALQAEIDQARRKRLQRLGFPADEAAALSALHTRNFM